MSEGFQETRIQPGYCDGHSDISCCVHRKVVLPTKLQAFQLRGTRERHRAGLVTRAPLPYPGFVLPQIHKLVANWRIRILRWCFMLFEFFPMMANAFPKALHAKDHFPLGKDGE